MSKERRKEILQQLDIKLKQIKALQEEVKLLNQELEKMDSRGNKGFRDDHVRTRRK